MGALIPSPEAGDASTNLTRMKKNSDISNDSSKSFDSAPERNRVNRSTLMLASNYNSTNSANRDAYKQAILTEDSAFDRMSNSTVHDHCQFPYYRSSKNNGKHSDAVLVKDVGVSCMLLKQCSSQTNVPETKFLIKELKKEYDDLSNITNKITTYTKNIISQLKNKNEKKHELFQHLMSSKYAIATEYTDSKGNLYLKLRLFRNAEIQCTPQCIVKDFSSIYRNRHVTRKMQSKRRNYPITQVLYKNQATTCQENMKSKNGKNFGSEFPKKHAEVNAINSSSYSSSSMYDDSIIKKRKTPNEKFRHVLTRFDDIDKWNYKNCSNVKNHNENLKRCEPVIFTNWKEISKCKQSEPKTSSVVCDESQEMSNTKKTAVQNLLINNVHKTKFHTVNIRIVKQNKKPI